MPGRVMTACTALGHKAASHETFKCILKLKLKTS